MPKLTDYWYRNTLHPYTIALMPLSKIFAACTSVRRFLYSKKMLSSSRVSVPVIIVGNITVGGTGKTPMVVWLAEYLKSQGFSPGIVTRGVGGKKHYQPHVVVESDASSFVGDEALLLKKRSACPVVIGIKRVAAAKLLLQQTNCNIILSDDGLQHYGLQRDIEIVLVDAKRQFGNKQLLPAGPLRESVKRVKSVHFVVENGIDSQAKYHMQLKPIELVSVKNPNQTLPISALSRTIHAVAGIGHPQQFFASLQRLGFFILPHFFVDHYQYKKNDLNFSDDLPIVMTEKDAMKCKDFAKDNWWYLKVEAQLNAKFISDFKARLIHPGDKICEPSLQKLF